MKSKTDREWIKTRNEAFKLNPEGEQFWKGLNYGEWIIAKGWYGVFGQLDPCHIFSRGSYIHMKYMVDNILIAPRYFHTCVDQYRNPFTLQFMDQEERYAMWIKFIGIDKWNYLLNKSRESIY